MTDRTESIQALPTPECREETKKRDRKEEKLRGTGFRAEFKVISRTGKTKSRETVVMVLTLATLATSGILVTEARSWEAWTQMARLLSLSAVKMVENCWLARLLQQSADSTS